MMIILKTVKKEKTMIYEQKQYSIWCDSCDEFIDFLEFDSEMDAIRIWKIEGWIIKKDKCICPECQEKTNIKD